MKSITTPEMPVVKKIFSYLENDSESFFKYVADDVDWIVEGRHPMAGHFYTKKDFKAATFDQLAKVLPGGPKMKLVNLIMDGVWAVAELQANARAISGLLYNNHYCWLTRWDQGKIVEVRAYLDSALVQQLFEENPV